jgi:mono/diheme cytochrome c family protein
MTVSQCGLRNAECGMKASRIAVTVGLLVALVGCQQRMATQPAHRPYEESSLFPHNQSARPLVGGVVHRGQLLSDDPLNTWLTEPGKAPKHTANYTAWLAEMQKPPVGTDGKPLTDKDGKPLPPSLSAEAAKELLAQAIQPGAPTDKANFVDTVPFEMTEADLKRGQVLYTAICAECHGGAGYANGKIPERGFLRPPSYHTDPEGKEKDWSRLIEDGDTVRKDFTGNPAGTSRGFYKYGFEVPLKEVPVGYIYQVIYWGYGGMASHETQLPKAEDRWRVAAFVRVLQLSQGVEAGKLPEAVKKELAEKAEKKPATGEGHK